MQDEVPKVMDIAGETLATLDRYGVGADDTDTFGRQCLMARRLAEAGVRFVQVTHGNWDHHFNLGSALANTARQVDRPIAGLLGDLADRGLLDDTLVIWGGEFGRTPHSQGADGRDHWPGCFTTVLAGGPFRRGFVYGASDRHAAFPQENPVAPVDLVATLYHALGVPETQVLPDLGGRPQFVRPGRTIHDLFA
jgi:uncharacterized protein (DUF1501 family)